MEKLSVKEVKALELEQEVLENASPAKISEYRNQFKVIYDVTSIPDGLAFDQLMKIADTGFILYNGESGMKPKVIKVGNNSEDVELIPKIVDVAGKTISIDAFNALFEEREFWRKELYKCKRSPYYYYVTYVSDKAEPDEKDAKAFIASLGIPEQPEGIENDSDAVLAFKESQRAVMSAYSDTVKLDYLKERKPCRDLLIEELNKQIEAKVKEVKDKLSIKFSEVDWKSVSDSDFTAKVVTEIRKTKVGKNYPTYSKLGKWDKDMLFITPIRSLCDIYLEVVK